jgi:class 3 adenylate cyclase/streptogramin lyase
VRDDSGAMHGSTRATTTFLFTDVEGSTQLLKSHRAEYASLLADHHRLLREAFAAHGGEEIDNQGDAFFVAFSYAKDAVLAAAACQRALAQHHWQGGASLRVRMGIHTGEADHTVDRYVGLSVHRAARICAVGHGGQVLVSQTTVSLLEDDEEDLPGIVLKDLGEHRLKDISRPVRLYQLDVDGLRTAFPPLAISDRPKPNRRKRVGLAAAAALLIAGAVAIALAFVNRSEAPPVVLPNSLVRIDPKTLKPTDVVPIGDAPDIAVVAGGFVWVTHKVLRDVNSGKIRNAGDRTLTRYDPSTGDRRVVGGLAPCGLTADPSGDVWVANCFASAFNVVRIDASTLDFKETLSVPGGKGFFRGLAYGGGWLWVSPTANHDTLTQIDPRTRAKRSIRLARRAGALAWSEENGDLWMNNFDFGSVTRMHVADVPFVQGDIGDLELAKSGAVQTIDEVAANPSFPVIDGDVLWAGDWAAPRVVRLRAVGSRKLHSISLPTRNPTAGVWNVATGADAVWATTPRDHALWRIDPRTNHPTRIPIPYLPSWVTVAPDGALWLTVRAA